MTQAVITVENLHKKFARRLRDAMSYAIRDMATELCGRVPNQELRRGEFWSVRDVSFSVRRGECVGLIGPNGAGKSTVLKIINGLLRPDRGLVRVRGTVGALIELGAGFNPVLTGRENVYINGSVLGFSKRQIDAMYNRIVDFSELEDSMETPVQNYSSGMKVRLGFAIAAQLRPTILLVDEILAVGDVGFRTKCINAINELRDSTAILFVSHSMPRIGKMCDRVIVMHHGEIRRDDLDVSRGIAEYESLFQTDEPTEAFGKGGIALLRQPIPTKYLDSECGTILIEPILEVTDQLPPVRLLVTVCKVDGTAVARWTSPPQEFQSGRYHPRIEIASRPLAGGRYQYHFHVLDADDGTTYLGVENVGGFAARGEISTVAVSLDGSMSTGGTT